MPDSRPESKSDTAVQTASPLLSRHMATDVGLLPDTRNRSGRCHLLGLPKELRLSIYECVYDERYRFPIFLGHPDGFTLITWKLIDGDQIPYTWAYEAKQLPHLLYTCRLIAQEATPVLYDSIIFGAHFSGRRGPQMSGTVWDLARCPFLSQIRRLDICSTDDVESVAHHIDLFTRKLHSSRPVKLKGVRLRFQRNVRVRDPNGVLMQPPRYEWTGISEARVADPVHLALMRIRCAPGFPLLHQLESRPCASEGVYAAFKTWSKARIDCGVVSA
ncbi:hypothetical protein LTR53_006559 [Teratosphaeriaceae sp. CCFEE 6253]|nr:hypothetical protein LTR53_006559 [Teratosphaeriaceae sp. CCFEE 6253]